MSVIEGSWLVEHLAELAFTGTILTLLLAGALWVFLKRMLERDLPETATARLERRQEIVKIVVQTFGAGAVLVGSLVALADLRLTRDNLMLAQKQESQRQLAAMFQAGIGQLGSEVCQIRMGGIHSLGQVARSDLDTYAKAVMDTMAAFVRDAASGSDEQWETPDGAEGAACVRARVSGTPGDVVAAMDVIRSISVAWHGLKNEASDPFPKVNLTRTYLRKIDLEGAKLPRADFSYANLRQVNLAGATLADSHFFNANLELIHLEGADLRLADFRAANLSRAYLQNADFRDADLRSATLDRALLQGADLHGARLNRGLLTGLDLDGVSFAGVLWYIDFLRPDPTARPVLFFRLFLTYDETRGWLVVDRLGKPLPQKQQPSREKLEEILEDSVPTAARRLLEKNSLSDQ